MLLLKTTRFVIVHGLCHHYKNPLWPLSSLCGIPNPNPKKSNKFLSSPCANPNICNLAFSFSCFVVLYQVSERSKGERAELLLLLQVKKKTMSAAVCGSKRSFFEELPSSPPVAKRIRCASSSSPIRFSAPSLLDQLRSVFPHMELHVNSLSLDSIFTLQMLN